MKKLILSIFFFVIIAFFSVGCTMNRELQEVELTQAKLIRIDTLYRYPTLIKQLTWKDENNIQFISLANMQEAYNLGVTMRVFRQR